MSWEILYSLYKRNTCLYVLHSPTIDVHFLNYPKKGSKKHMYVCEELVKYGKRKGIKKEKNHEDDCNRTKLISYVNDYK